MDTISVRVEEPEDGPYDTVLGRSPGGGLREIEVGKLRQSFSHLAHQVSEIFQDLRTVGAYRLKAVEIEVEVSSEGGVHLVGSLKTGVKGAIKLTFSE